MPFGSLEATMTKRAGRAAVIVAVAVIYIESLK
jgi:hypothetical protein